MSPTNDRTAGTRWAHTPHVRVGDPCYQCGTPMVPATPWRYAAIPEGHRRHAGYGLCRRCYTSHDPQIVALLAAAREDRP